MTAIPLLLASLLMSLDDNNSIESKKFFLYLIYDCAALLVLGILATLSIKFIGF